MPGYFDQFEGGSPSASRDYDAYMWGTDGPAWGARPAFQPPSMPQQPPGSPQSSDPQSFGPPPPSFLNRLFQAMRDMPRQPAFGGKPTYEAPGMSWVDPAVVRATTLPSQPPSMPHNLVTKLAGAPDIAARISRMLGPPQEPEGSPDFLQGSDAAYRGMIPPPSEYMPPRIPIRMAERPQTSGAFGIPSGIMSWFGGQRRAHGGPIHMMRGGYPELYDRPMRQGHFAPGGGFVAPDGSGDGRSDHVEARLSPGEYVMDAETVSMLGNGDNDAGARKLDKMRVGVRKQKGRALVKGKFSPDAKKDAMEYLSFDGVSDGLRRRGKERE